MTAASAQVRPEVGRRVHGLDAAQRRERRTDLILDAAFTLFADHGYTATTVEQISARAQVSTKSFYEIFDNKQACFTRVLTSITEQVQAALTPPRHVAASMEADTVAVLMESLVHALVSDPRLAKILFERPGPGLPEADPQYEAVWRGLVREVQAVLEAQDGGGARRRPSPKPYLHPRKVAVGFVGGVRELIAEWLADADLADADAAQVLATDLVLYYECVRGERSLRTDAQ